MDEYSAPSDDNDCDSSDSDDSDDEKAKNMNRQTGASRKEGARQVQDIQCSN